MCTSQRELISNGQQVCILEVSTINAYAIDVGIGEPAENLRGARKLHRTSE
jgi:hypothetical protein